MVSIVCQDGHFIEKFIEKKIRGKFWQNFWLAALFISCQHIHQLFQITPLSLKEVMLIFTRGNSYSSFQQF